MTQVHFTLNLEEIQNLIDVEVNDNLSKSILTKVFNQLMEKEQDEYLNNEAYQRDPNRMTYRNGYYDRDYTTLIGTLNLRVPRTRDGKFSTEIFERYQRNEKALLLTMLEMYIQGVSTRKVSKVIENLCGKTYSKSFVSSLTKQLDEEVRQWRHHDLSPVQYAYLVVDVIYIKVRENHKVVSKACHIAIGISEEGKRRLLGFDISDGESDYSWSRFFNYLKERGLNGVKMVISDAHMGLVKAIKENFLNVSWQRCQVHFLRNILAKTPKKETKEFKEDIKALFRIQDIKIARIVKNELFKKYEGEKKYQASLAILDEGFEDAFTYLNESVVHSRLKSTNCLERLNEEIRRRERVIRIFPNVESAYRLIGAMLIDQDEEWLTADRIYIQM
ncbi:MULTISPECIES: IS256 family transposase [Dolosigranulum]|uniref:Mutator family transposase n=1 Tax=Dolosigranulum savutiense TaxID=3110288 RepID=A0AB74TZK0_9LACT|nr:IS256 family transposase [Dolosigranulum pigrum]QTJ38271.1 IS256 family transposase [Dolosigranulum pigrum]QTJ58615.1 IS256 family transposase [Dolosigranulum pigrum]